MKCILMNKNTPIALIEYNTTYHAMEKIDKEYNIDYAPLSFINAKKNRSLNEVKVLNEWFKSRGIPSWRKDLERLLERLNITSPDELLTKAFALSLSDQYWIKEKDSHIEWKDINFFMNDFEYKGYLAASLSSTNKTEKISLHSPNNTTDGMLQKGWIIENGKRILVKGTYAPSRQEPINEWLASTIGKRLGFDYCNYTVEISDNKIISKCENFVHENEEIITAKDIFSSEQKNNNVSDLEHYINLLEKHEVPNARENVENMLILDYIMMNDDRHLRNFGVIRNVDTLKWVKTTPIFDTGESMQCRKLTSEINFLDGEGKFFTNTERKFSTYLREIKEIERIPYQKLNRVQEEYKQMLIDTQKYTEITEERTEKLVQGLALRIALLGKQIEKAKHRLMRNQEKIYLNIKW